MGVQVERVDNGWRVKGIYCERIFLNAEDMLLQVYAWTCADYNVGDTVQIVGKPMKKESR
jgi:hypothetical protein